MSPTLVARTSLHLAHAQRHHLRESVAFAQLLAMDAAQVEAAVAAELATNPALVRSERQHCVSCGAWSRAVLCSACRPAGLPREPEAPPPGPRQQVLADLLATCRSSRDRVIAHHLIASLDRSGFLTEPVADLADRLGEPHEAVAAVHHRLVEIGPPGIAVADVGQRLLALAARSPVEPPEELTALLTGDPQLLLGDGHPAAAACLAWIREHLDPHLDLDQPGPAEARRPADLVVLDELGGLTVRPWGLAQGELEVDPAFVALIRAGTAALTDEELGQVRTQVERARSLVARLEGRTRTVVRVAQAVVARQEGFIRVGPTAHAAMTRAAVAAELGLHESTVGRAVSGTTLQLPDHTVRELASFFGGRRAVLAELERLLREHPDAGDRVLAGHLADRGFPVARRTVAKYRHELGAKRPSPAPAPARS